MGRRWRLVERAGGGRLGDDGQTWTQCEMNEPKDDAEGGEGEELVQIVADWHGGPFEDNGKQGRDARATRVGRRRFPTGSGRARGRARNYGSIGGWW